MSVVSSVVYRAFRVVDPSTGLGVTGLVVGDFTIASYSRAYGAAAWGSYVSSYAIAEIGDGWYSLTFTNPSSAGYRLITIKLANCIYAMNISGLDGEVMTQDLASIYAAVAKPVVVLSGTGSIGQRVPLTLIAYRYRVQTVVFRDTNGVAIDLSGATYNNFLLSVRDKTQSNATGKWDMTTAVPTPGSVTGDASGNLVITWPEDATFYAKIVNPATSFDPYSDLAYEVTADQLSTAKTIALIPSSPISLLRREVGTA